MKKHAGKILITLAVLAGITTTAVANLDVYGELRTAFLELLGSDPGTNATEGRIYYNTTDDRVKAHDGTSFATLLQEFADDTTPTASGNLDMNGNSILDGLGLLSLDDGITDVDSILFDGSGGLTISGSTIALTTGATDLALNTVGGGRVSIGANLIPTADGTRELGLAANRWSDFYLNGSIYHYGSTSGFMRLRAAATTTDYDLFWPDAQGALDQVLVNDGSGNLSWSDQSGGSGSGEINALSGSDHDFEASVGNWMAYADAAGVDPVDGTGGSPTVTMSRTTTTSELHQGGGSGKCSKDAANRQGEGCSVDLTLHPRQAGAINKIEAAYTFSGANGDIGSYMYCDLDGTPFYVDVTAGTDGTDKNLIAPKSVRGGPEFLGTFVAPDEPDLLDCRLIFHVKTTSTSAWDLIFDDVIVGTGKISQGAVITDFQTTDVSIDDGTKGTVEHDVLAWRRVGSSIHMTWSYRQTAAGTAGTNNYVFTPNLPAGITFDTSFTRIGAAHADTVGEASCREDATEYIGVVRVNSGTELRIEMDDAASTTSPIGGSTGVCDLGGTDVRYSFTAEIPVVEWQGKGVVNLIKEENLTSWEPIPSPETLVSASTNASCVGYKRRVGSNLEVQLDCSYSGATDNVALAITPPDGLTIDIVPAQGRVPYGSAEINDSGVQAYVGLVLSDIGSNTVRIAYAAETGTDVQRQIANLGNSLPFNAGSGDSFESLFSIPILEWSNQPSPLVGFSIVDENSAGLVPSLDGICDASRSICYGYDDPAESCSVNCDTASVNEVKFIKIGPFVYASATAEVDPTSSGASFSLNFDPPIASDFTTSSDAAGSCESVDGTLAFSPVVFSNVATDDLRIQVPSADITFTTSEGVRCTFVYEIK